MKYFIDGNYPGVTYRVPETIAEEFCDHMYGEGAAIREIPAPIRGDEVRTVKGVHETHDFWGLEFDD